MQRIFLAVLALVLAMSAAQAGQTWKLLDPAITAGVPTKIRLQLIDCGKPVTVSNLSVRVDMGPDGMATMTTPASVSSTNGTIVVETNLTAPGRWAVTIGGTVNGKPVKGSVVVKAKEKSAEAASPPPANSRKIVFYRNPMIPTDTSPVPKKDPMGMAYVPVYADEVSQKPGTIRLTTEKMQRAGVRTTAVTRMALARQVRATGTVAADETRQAVLAARFSGFVEKLYVAQTGDVVRAGQPLARVWAESAEVLIKEADYIGSLQSGAPAHAEMAARLLRQYGVSQSELNAMAKTGVTTRSFTIVAPASGTVMEKNAVLGMHFAAGDPLFKTTDLRQVWVLAEVSERDLSSIKPGQTASVGFRDNPSESFDGKVLLIYPQIDPATRTVKVRIAVNNTGNRLRIGQYADVRIDVPAANTPVLSVPASAIVDDGSKQVAFVAKGGGLFEPRTVKLGARTADRVQVVAGLAAGEQVVTSGNFLIDAESNLQTALQTFGSNK